ncbi:MAG: thiamine pyrophosphate-binding protein [Burkholderiales bacterium]
MGVQRGADVLAQALAAAGARTIFSLSGNQIMPVYDAALDAGLRLIHVRHEAAAVHMADAWARLNDTVGIALLTAGQGHTNGVAALPTAWFAESPVVMLSGAAPLSQAGRGAFQEMDQPAIAAPLVKASWAAQSAAGLGEDLAKAIRLARSGRPGPVHISLPFDVLEEKIAGVVPPPAAAAFAPVPQPPGKADTASLLQLIAGAKRPLLITGPAMASARGRALCTKAAAALGVPVVCMESPRGVNDPSLGAFADVLKTADLVVLLGKRPDYTLRFGQAPALAADCRFAIVDPETNGVDAAKASLAGAASRVVFTAVADTAPALEALCSGGKRRSDGWMGEVASAIAHRPAAWATLTGADAGVHPVQIGRAVQGFINQQREAVFVADGGEFGQWAQACVSAPERVINGVGGSIGSAIPFAFAARVARPQASVVALLGDGTFGFHLAEFDTAVRERVPFIAVVGNDACWNAEYQIQVNTYGAPRAQGCTLLPTRYDRVVEALGGFGEHVTRAEDLPAALERAAASGLPACINVALDGKPAPTVSRTVAPAGAGAH